MKALARADKKKPRRHAVGGGAAIGSNMMTRIQQPERRVTAIGPEVRNATLQGSLAHQGGKGHEVIPGMLV